MGKGGTSKLGLVVAILVFAFDVVTDLLLVIPSAESVWTQVWLTPSFSTGVVAAGWSCLAFAAGYGTIIFIRGPIRLAVVLGMVETGLEVGGLTLLSAQSPSLDSLTLLSLGATVLAYLYTLVSENHTLEVLYGQSEFTYSLTVATPIIYGGLLVWSRFTESIFPELSVLIVSVIELLFAGSTIFGSLRSKLEDNTPLDFSSVE